MFIMANGSLHYVEDELYHHGIKGMKWGVRRFRKYSGGLTAAGKKRYGDDTRAEVKAAKAAYAAAKRDKAKSHVNALVRSGDEYSFSKKRRQANSARWNDYFKKTTSANKAQADYRDAKAKHQEAMNTPEGKAERARKIKKGLKVGAAVAGTALAAYGAYKVNQYVKTKNCQIAAKKGYEASEKMFEAITDNAAKSFMSGQSTGYRVSANHGVEALSRARSASSDSFGTAARNVINYKKAGNSLSSLDDLRRYANMPERFVEVNWKKG